MRFVQSSEYLRMNMKLEEDRHVVSKNVRIDIS